MSEFLYYTVNLAESTPVEILRTGVFVDRFGKEVAITEDDLDAFVTNFEAGAAGQDVPIDINHEKQEAGGWLKTLKREGDRLVGTIDWNELGKQLVGDKIYRYMSATIDLAGKIIKTVSLTNLPAVKNLKPIELGEGVYGLAEDEGFKRWIVDLIKSVTGNNREQQPGEHRQSGGNTEMTDTERAELREQIRKEERAKVEAELAQQSKREAELREEVRKELETELAEQMKERQALAEFANELCNGEFGLSTPPSEVVEMLLAVPAGDVRDRLKATLKAKVVNFGEKGSGGDGKDKLPKLPDYARNDVLTGDLTVADLFKSRAVSGVMTDYDLSEFTKEQVGAS